jgi:hypothetical protein
MPVIDRGDDYFQAGLYTGNGSTQTITGLRFQPDFVWIKGRSGATDHALYDAVRGVQNQLESNTTTAETAEATGLTAFTSDGFTVGSLAQVNTNAATYVYWAWKANGAGVSNTAGTITSTVSVNTTSGFSIVTYDSDPTGTVGHGLGVAPKIIIEKKRDTTSDWIVSHSLVDGSWDFLRLNTTAANSNAVIAAPTSTVFTPNASGNNMVAYCFAPVAGYSAFGSYTGNGSADGSFVYTGFRPAFVLVKDTTSSGNFWLIEDSVRNSFNPADKALFPNNSNAEGTQNATDFLSNGFKIRSTGSNHNTNNSVYIYAAFAENPFSIALAR